MEILHRADSVIIERLDLLISALGTNQAQYVHSVITLAGALIAGGLAYLIATSQMRRQRASERAAFHLNQLTQAYESLIEYSIRIDRVRDRAADLAALACLPSGSDQGEKPPDDEQALPDAEREQQKLASVLKIKDKYAFYAIEMRIRAFFPKLSDDLERFGHCRNRFIEQLGNFGPLYLDTVILGNRPEGRNRELIKTFRTPGLELQAEIDKLRHRIEQEMGAIPR